MNMKLFGLVSLCGVLAIACGDSGTSSGTGGSSSGGGNAGGSSNNSGGSSSVTQPTTTVGGGGTGGAPLECDTGEAGDATQPEGTPAGDICSACITCAVQGNCSDELVAFQGDPNAMTWSNCLFGDGTAANPGCPDDDPATANVDEFAVCSDACDAASPGVSTLYIAVLSCAICVECPTNCNAAGNCM